MNGSEALSPLERIYHQAKDAAFRETHDPGGVLNQQKLTGMLNGALANSEPANPALRGRIRQEPVTVTAEEFDQLELAMAIATVTKGLLKAGNQRLAMQETGGASTLLTIYLRTLDSGSSTQRATNSLIAGVGNCGEHAAVVFEFARMLDLPVATYFNNNISHVYAALFPDSSNPIVIDPWTDFPTVCRASEYLYKHEDAKQVEHHERAGNARLNLVAVLAAREKIDGALGGAGLLGQVREDMRVTLGVRSKTLDRAMQAQGVQSYREIVAPPDRPKEAARIQRKREKVEAKVEKHIQKSFFRSRAPLAEVTGMGGHVQISGAEERGADHLAAMESAIGAVHRSLTHEATDEAERNAKTKALKRALMTPTLEATKQVSVTRQTVIRTETSEVRLGTTVKVRVRVVPTLFDARYHATTNQYRAEDSSSESSASSPFRFDYVPLGHNETVAAAAAKKDYLTYTRLDALRARIDAGVTWLKGLGRKG